MADCSLRITALGASGDSHRKRRRLEELVEVLGAKVAQHSTRWGEITHIVCVVPELLDRKLYEAACRKSVPVVSIQWLFDCFRMNVFQAEDRYGVADALGKMDSQGKASAADLATQASGSSAPGILAGHEILISPSALGSDAQLPQMAEELGGSVRTWRTAAELAELLEAHGATGPPAPGGASNPSPLGGATSGGSCSSSGPARGQRHTVVLLDKEEVCKENDPLAACVAKVPVENRGIFVVPAWLSETYQQRRRLPLDAFRAPAAAEPPGASAAKRPRLGLGELGEAAYAWQPAALKSLEVLAEDSRARALQSKAQQKVTAGLRLAELRREPSRVGG